MRTSQIPEFTGSTLATGDDVIANVQITPGTFRLRRVPRNIVGATGPTGPTGAGFKTIKDYGAKVDGVTDDSAAILAAIVDKDSNGGMVLIPGTTAIGSAGWTGLLLSGVTNLTIAGFGQNSGIKILAAASQTIEFLPCAFKLNACVDVTIRDLIVNGNAVNSIGLGLESCQRCVVENVTVHSTAANGIMAAKGNDNQFRNNIVRDTTNAGRGLWIGNTNTGAAEIRALITENRIFNCDATGIGGTLKDSIISNNTISNCIGSGIALGSSVNEDYRDVTIQGNVCKGNHFHGIQSDDIGGNYPRGISIIGNVCEDQFASGIFAAGTIDWVIAGNICKNNNHDAVGTARGIQVELSATRLAIVGNICSDDQTVKTQTTGIYLAAQTAGKTLTDIIIAGNVCYQNAGMNIEITTSGGTISRLLVANNLCNGNSVTARGISYSGATTDLMIIGNICRNHTTFDFGTFGTFLVPSVLGSNNIGTTAGLIPMKLNSHLVAEGTAAPTTGTWTRGDRVWNSLPVSGDPKSFVCTVGGTPGTWVSEGNL